MTGLTLKADASRLRQPWWTRSADSTYLTGKCVFIFGDGTDVAAAARIARDEMGYEGANVIFDTWIHPLVMGLEEHLLTMFRDEFQFHDAAGASHHGGHGPKAMEREELSRASGGDIFTQKNAVGSKFEVIAAENIIWLSDAGRELKKIPFFCARQGPPQHRNLRSAKGHHPDQHRHAVRGKGPLCAIK